MLSLGIKVISLLLFALFSQCICARREMTFIFFLDIVTLSSYMHQPMQSEVIIFLFSENDGFLISYMELNFY
jgi:hypothetical protein